MSKVGRILGVVGSPRVNGNTHILVESILEAAKAEGARTEMLFLKDLNIQECIGCHACWRGKECTQQDDMNGVYPKIIASDVIVFGTPVYWYGPTALMKGFIDRFVYFNCAENREHIRGKLAVVASPFEEESVEAASLLVAFFEKCFEYLEMELVGKILAPGVTLKGEVRERGDYLREARGLGKVLAGGA
jgi:multimeric flavodoxin WrbA